MGKYTLRIVDQEWLKAFAMCAVTSPVEDFWETIVDRCVMVAGVPEAFRSGASAAPDGGDTADNGEDNGGRPDAEHITPPMGSIKITGITDHGFTAQRYGETGQGTQPVTLMPPIPPAKQLAEERWTKYLVTGKAPTPAEDLQDYLNVAGPALGIDPMEREKLMKQAEEAFAQQVHTEGMRNREDLFLKDIPKYLTDLTTDHSTPFLDLTKAQEDHPNALKIPPPTMPMPEILANADVSSNRFTYADNSGEWYVEPAALLPNDGVWLGSGRKKRKVAEAEAQRLADETGVPWRVVRWYGTGSGEIAQAGIHEDDSWWTARDGWYSIRSEDEAERTKSGFKDAKRIARRMSRDGTTRCRITRTFFPETLTGS